MLRKVLHFICFVYFQSYTTIVKAFINNNNNGDVTSTGFVCTTATCSSGASLIKKKYFRSSNTIVASEETVMMNASITRRKMKKHPKSKLGWSATTTTRSTVFLKASAASDDDDASAAKPSKRRAKTSKTTTKRASKSTTTKTKRASKRTSKAKTKSSNSSSVVAASGEPVVVADEMKGSYTVPIEAKATAAVEEEETKDELVEAAIAVAGTNRRKKNNKKESTNEILSDDELYKLLYDDQDLSAVEDIDYAELDRLRIKAETELYDQYEYFNDNTQLIDDDGIEIGWDPIFGSSNPIDGRAILSKIDSYMVSDETKDDRMLILQSPNDEIDYYNEINNIVTNRSSQKLEVYQDPYLKVNVPRHTRPWYGTIDMDINPYQEKDWLNNRYTKPEAKTDVSKLTPYEARKYAVQLARSVNNEWLPNGYSQQRNHEEVKIFQQRHILAGSLYKGPIDEKRLKDLKPILHKLGGIADVLSISPEGIYRFHYKGLMKHRLGMENWVTFMLHEQGTTVENVRFETGYRKVDPRDTVFKGYECYGRILPNNNNENNDAEQKSDSDEITFVPEDDDEEHDDDEEEENGEEI